MPYKPRFLNSMLPLMGSLILLLGCENRGEDERLSAEAVEVDTLEGGAVHVRNPARGIWSEAERWRAEEVFQIGARGGAGPEVFGELRDLAADSRGRVYVVDSQAEVIRLFGSEGEYVRTLGRPGQGPGELQLVRGVVIGDSDRVWALDGGNFRYSVWDSAGAFVGTRERPFPFLPRALNGNAVGARLVEFTGGVFAGADGRSRYGFVRLGLGDTLVDSFPGPQVPSPDRFQVQPEPAGMTFAFPVPFAPEFHLTIGPEGRYWTGMSDAFRLYEMTLQGDTTTILEREFSPPVVSDAEIQAALDHEQVRHMRSVGGEFDVSRIPRTKPIFDWISVDNRGYLWVGLVPTPEGPTTVDVFDPEGSYLGQVLLPVKLLPEPVPVVRGGRLWGTIRDEYDVQYVVGLAIEES